MVSTTPASPARRRRVLAIIAIVIVLILLCLGSLSAWARSASLQARCGKRQSQLINACYAYSAQVIPDFWPSFPNLEKFQSVLVAGSAHQARLVTVGILATLSWLDTLPGEHFSCPAQPGRGPKTRFSPQDQTIAAWGAAPDASAAYAIDWSVDMDAPADYILIADRDPRNHRGTVIACFGDSHTVALRGYDPDPTLPVIGLRTESDDGQPVPRTPVPASLDIYAPASGDLPHQLTQGGGQLDHPWVK